MTRLYHLNCVRIVSPINDNVGGHCLLLQEDDKLLLIDTGIGLLDTLNPAERIGQALVDLVGYRFAEAQTAVRQLVQLGLDPSQVTDCIISHLDNDHIGGLVDFPQAIVHVSQEELDNFTAGNPRYLKTPLSHHPPMQVYSKSDFTWFGLEARKVQTGAQTDIFLIPLFGHTLGHCGVALHVNDTWWFYIADAYYMRIELEDTHHPVNELAAMRADDNTARLATLEQIRNFVTAHPEIKVFGYHDMEEFRLYES
ncbi:MAG: MBL fold metallo-hydrolase [Saprospiraceae bacterium]|nr:MBL fold metallo-hydrolase [Saprospiraceae bacterium]